MTEANPENKRSTRSKKTKSGPDQAVSSLSTPTVKAVTKQDFSKTFLAKTGIPICWNCGIKKCSDGQGIVKCCDNPIFR